LLTAPRNPTEKIFVKILVPLQAERHPKYQQLINIIVQ
jgi:hypothetical protein